MGRDTWSATAARTSAAWCAWVYRRLRQPCLAPLPRALPRPRLDPGARPPQALTPANIIGVLLFVFFVSTLFTASPFEPFNHPSGGRGGGAAEGGGLGAWAKWRGTYVNVPRDSHAYLQAAFPGAGPDTFTRNVSRLWDAAAAQVRAPRWLGDLGRGKGRRQVVMLAHALRRAAASRARRRRRRCPAICPPSCPLPAPSWRATPRTLRPGSTRTWPPGQRRGSQRCSKARALALGLPLPPC